MKKQLFRYWVGMNASALQAAIHSTKVFVATATVHAVADSIPALRLDQMAAVFGLAFGMEILNWLDAHPLIDVIDPAAKTP